MKTQTEKELETQKDLKEFKEIKKISLKEPIEVDGGFFYIDKTDIRRFGDNEMLTRYFLKTIVRKEKMEKLKKFLKIGNQNENKNRKRT